MKALLFDLDDTLYLEGEYVLSGYMAVACHARRLHGCDEGVVFAAMMNVLVREGRRSVFPMVVRRFLKRSARVAELVDVYRRHDPQIHLLPGYAELIRRLARRYRIGIITDGLPEVQRRKVRALRLHDRVDQIVYTWDQGPDRQKPHPSSYRLMLETLGVRPCDSLFIGDNGYKDCAGAHGVGVRFVHVCAQRSRNDRLCEAADFRIESLHQLPALLASCG